MPRLPHSLLLKAYNLSPLLPLVLRGTRSLPLAINELRWLRQHIHETYKTLHKPSPQKELFRLCWRRSHGEPLQYLLGSQPFGNLSIKCRPGVLIPRPETEAYTTHLANLLNKGALHPELTQKLDYVYKARPLTILDVCSGSGCISLLLYSLLVKKFEGLRVYGWDVSEKAVKLAVENLRGNAENGGLKLKKDGKSSPVQFDQVDIFGTFTQGQKKQLHKADIIISNPPYISEKGFMNDTTRSVRNWEPRLALVPEIEGYGYQDDDMLPEDVFYKRLIHLHTHLSRPKVLIMEVGDPGQALRVADMAVRTHLPSRINKVEIWKDWPEGKEEKQDEFVVNGTKIPVRGEGNMRAVVVRSFDRVWGNGGAISP